MATPEVMMLANRRLAFDLYEFYLDGVPTQDLAEAYSLPVDEIQKSIERTRVRLENRNLFAGQLTAKTDSAV